MPQLKLILPVFGVLAMVVPGAAQATVCHHFIASTSCNGGGVNDVCDPSGGGGGAGPWCNLAVNGGSGNGTLTAVSVFTSGTMYSNKPFTGGGGGSHHWEMWGTDTAGNNFCCVYNPAPTWTFNGSQQQDTILLNFWDSSDE